MKHKSIKELNPDTYTHPFYEHLSKLVKAGRLDESARIALYNHCWSIVAHATEQAFEKGETCEMISRQIMIQEAMKRVTTIEEVER